MLGNYLIVSKDILPDYYEKVVEARNLINEGSVKGVSEAVKIVGISRSTYYKYKDYIFTPQENALGRKAVISLLLSHEKGILSEVINRISGISRSTYYKYKDYIFTPQENALGRKAVISLLLSHEKGILSEVINRISASNINILTITQSLPINRKASVVLSIDLSDLSRNIHDVVEEMGQLNGVNYARLISVE